MNRLLEFASPFAAVAALWWLAARAGRPRITKVSRAWRSENARLEIVSEPRMEYVLRQGEREIARSESEDALRAARAEILRARGGEA